MNVLKWPVLDYAKSARYVALAPRYTRSQHNGVEHHDRWLMLVIMLAAAIAGVSLSVALGTRYLLRSHE